MSLPLEYMLLLLTAQHRLEAGRFGPVSGGCECA